MTITDLIEQLEASARGLEAQIAGFDREIADRRAQNQRERRANSDDDALQTIVTARATETARLEVIRARVAEMREEQKRDLAIDALQREVHPTGVGSPGGPVVEHRSPTITQPLGAGIEAGTWVRTNDGKPATVARGSRFADHELVAEHAARSAADAHVIGQHGSLGQMVRAMSTTSGSAVVPTVWVGDIIDRARNMAAVLKAGAEIVPMDAKQVKIGRLTGDPTAAFRAEGSTISASDPTFDNVTLDAKTMSCLVVGSMEWFQDSDDVDNVVTNAIAQAFANQLDLVSLYGGVEDYAGGAVDLATPPNPRGVLGALNAVASSSVLGGATNGTAQTQASYYNELLDLIFKPREYNEEPNALIYNAKLALQYAKAYASDYQPLRAPAEVDKLQRHVTNQIPSYDQGTMTGRATDVFCGDWSQLLIGQRLDFTIQTLTERYAENGQIGIVAHWRGDVQPARARAFAVYRALQGAS